MTRASAKFIALAIVGKWYWQGRPVSGCSSGYRLVGTQTGRFRGQFDPMMEYAPGDRVANQNGDLFVAVDYGAVERNVLSLMQISIEHGRPIITATQQQPVLREGND